MGRYRAVNQERGNSALALLQSGDGCAVRENWERGNSPLFFVAICFSAVEQ